MVEHGFIAEIECEKLRKYSPSDRNVKCAMHCFVFLYD